MFTDKMATITAAFSAELMESLRAAAREELEARRARQAPAPAAAKKPAAAKAQKQPVVAKVQKPPVTKPKAAPVAKPAAPAPSASKPISGATLSAAVRYFAERGNKGATSMQLASFLDEQGLGTDRDVIAELTTRGSVRDAGFRRSTGTGNKTSPVFVAS